MTFTEHVHKYILKLTQKEILKQSPMHVFLYGTLIKRLTGRRLKARVLPWIHIISRNAQKHFQHRDENISISTWEYLGLAQRQPVSSSEFPWESNRTPCEDERER